MEVSTLKKSRSTAKSKFTRLRKSIEKAVNDGILESTVRSRFIELKLAWEEIQRRHEEYINQLQDDENPEEEEWISPIFNEYEATEMCVDNYFHDIQRKRNEDAEKKEKEAMEDAKDAEIKLVQSSKQREIKEIHVRRQQEDMIFRKCYKTIREMILKPKTETMANIARAEKRLKESFERITSIHMSLNVLTEVADAEFEKWFVNLFEMLNDICVESDAYLDRVEDKEKTQQQPTKEVTKQMGIRLERIKFDNFDGNIRKYPIFKTEFLKHIKPQHLPHEEAIVLKSYLVSEVHRDIENVDDAVEIWKRLDKRYGDEGKLVDSIMADIKSLERSENTLDTLILIETLEKAHSDLKSLGMEKEISNSTIVSMVEGKLPEYIMEKWVEIVTGEDRITIGRDKFPALMKLLLQFKERIEYRQSSIRMSGQKGWTNVVNGKYRDEMKNDRTNNRRTPWCWMHPNSNDHPIWRCKMFEEKGVAEKIDLMRANNACFSCLGTGHMMMDCRRGLKCRVDNCGLSHNKLLHEAYLSGVSFHGKTLVDHGNNNNNSNTLLLLQKIMAKATNEGLRKVGLNCLWDCGSNLSFITTRKAKQLKLKGTPIQIQIVKVGGVIEKATTNWYTIFLVDNLRRITPINVIGLDRISSSIESVNMSSIIEIFKGRDSSRRTLDESDVDRPTEGEVDCLIGYEVAGLHPVRIASANHLLLLENRYGLVVGGTHCKIKDGTKKVVQHGVILNVNMCMCLEKFYNIEQLGIQCTPRCGNCKCGSCHPGGSDMTLKEERELELIDNNLSYNEKERVWTAAYPFIRDPRELPNNKHMVLKLLLRMEKILLKNPELAEVYQAQMTDMKNRKVCRKLTEGELSIYDGPVHYIAHHVVLKPESESTPCRLVFNVSAKYMGHVLNEYYAKGPDILNNMLGVILRFREELFALVGDISKMFHSIKITKKDQMTQLYLWRDLKLDQPVDTYAMTVVNFGCKPSGTIAMTALRKTAQMSSVQYPIASSVIVRNSYMDDIPACTESAESRDKLRDEMDIILAKGGFTIKKWVYSKNFDMMNRHNEREKQIKDLSPGGEMERMLGMSWDTKYDKLFFRMKTNCDKQIKTSQEKVTKRLILSYINGIFDPLGLVGPVTVRAKMLMRRLWIGDEKVDWDEEVSDGVRREWMKLCVDLKDIENISFKRCVKPENAVGNPSLVIFSDGSQSAYGAVAYTRWETTEGTFISNIIASKNRIAPVKTMDVVRLELAGAVVSKRVRVFVEKEMDYTFDNIWHVVDSEIVKAMIEKESYGYNTYAANRIGEIQRDTNQSEWYWVPGKLNISDWVTRGRKPCELDEVSVWQCGPQFLSLPLAEWPVTKETNVKVLPERKAIVNSAITEKKDSLAARIDIERFSKLLTLINTTARILNLYSRFQKGKKKEINEYLMKELNCDVLLKAEKLWVADAQQVLTVLMKSGKLDRLCPQMQEGIIYVGGRASKVIQQSWNRQKLILLPYNHKFSRLVAEHEHKQGGHLGVSASVARVRAKYWIINLFKMMKSIRFRCVVCRKKEKVLCGQQMADLPVERLLPSPPFYNTGIDYFGPFVIKGEVNKRFRGKCFGVIFTCFVTRAVYLDVSVNYSTDAFLQTLRRFTAVHGWPKRFHSDKGTSLVAASKELREAIANLDRRQMQEFGIVQGNEWTFSSADAPWMNGVTESLVKTTKRCLKVVIGEQVMSFSELQTVLFEVAQIVNQRPIGRIPTETDDDTYLCPNDLMMGRASPTVPQGPFKDRECVKHRFEFIQRIVGQFWKRWHRDVFPNVVVRQKWHIEKRNVMVGDVVLIHDSNAVRGKYKMGVVKEVMPSDDGRIRRVMISYKNNEDGVEYRGKPYVHVERAVQRLVVIQAADELGNNE